MQRNKPRRSVSSHRPLSQNSSSSYQSTNALKEWYRSQQQMKKSNKINRIGSKSSRLSSRLSQGGTTFQEAPTERADREATKLTSPPVFSNISNLYNSMQNVRQPKDFVAENKRQYSREGFSSTHNNYKPHVDSSRTTLMTAGFHHSTGNQGQQLQTTRS